MKLLRAYVFLAILVKVIFLVFLVQSFYFKNLIRKEPDNKKYKDSLEIIDRLKNQTGFIFTILMAILMIILFKPSGGDKIVIDSYTKTMLCFFGILLIMTSDWLNFFHL
jgi:hypothetical protein